MMGVYWTGDDDRSLCDRVFRPRRAVRYYTFNVFNQPFMHAADFSRDGSVELEDGMLITIYNDGEVTVKLA